MDNNIETQNQTSTSTQIRQYLVLALEYWYLFVLAIVISVGVFIYKNKFAYTQYGTYTTVLVKKQNSTPEQIAGGLLLSPTRNLDNEMGLLRSYDMANLVIKKLNFTVSYFLDNKLGYDPELYKKAPFIVILDTLKAQTYNQNIEIQILDENSFKLEIPAIEYSNKFSFGDKIDINNYGFIINKDSSIFNLANVNKKYYFHLNDEVSLTKLYKNKLNVELMYEKTSILWIWLEGKTPQKDIDFLNTLVDLYIKDRLSEKNVITEKTIDFIDLQLEGFSDSLKKAEDDLQYFKQANSINISDEGQNLLDQLQDLDKEKKQQQMKRDYYKYMLTVVENNPEDMLVMSPSILGFDDPVLEQYISSLSEAISNQNVLRFSIKKNADLPPNVISSLEIENLEKTIQQHITQTIKYTKGSLDEVSVKIKEFKDEIYKLPVAERQMLQITRKFDLNNDIYTFLLQRRMEAGITLASNTPDVKIIDKARPETILYKGRSGGGNLPKNLMIAFAIVAVIIFGREILKNKIEDKSELEKLVSVPIIASINHNHRDSQLPTLKYQKSSISETFRLLRTNLQYTLLDKKQKMIVVSSTISGEGKSFISANLASIISVTNKKVLLVGLDLRKPRVQDIFEVENTNGISDYLIGNVTYEDLIRPSKHKNLFIAMPGTIPPNPAELIESNKMGDFFDRVKQEFDYVIVDTPPVGIVADALLLAQRADAFLYVIRQNYSSKSSVKLLNEVIQNNPLKNVNIIFNGVKKSVTYGLKYGYGYGYGYGYTYGQGYYDDDNENIDKDKSFFKKLNEKILSKFLGIFNRK